MIKKNVKSVLIFVFAILFIILLIIFLIKSQHTKYSQIPYSAKSLGITEITSEKDEDNDDVDDYSDICEGAKAYISTLPKYKSKYYEGGYPDDGCGVCTDVIWNALKAAGYDLKSMVDADIATHPDTYTNINTPDPNIDFRRVKNIKIFLDRNAKIMSLSFDNPEDWQAGDIVVFTKHIAICSDKRNKDGIPFIIHHDSKGPREANDINHYKIVGHYRWEITTLK